MNAVCLVTFRPNKIWCDFLNLFKYKIFIVIDDNDFDLSDFTNYHNITFVKVDDEKCKLNGYLDTSFTLNKLISGWDKALYYFGVEEKNFEFIWYLEDDVFFYNEDTLMKIDIQYINEDLLSNTVEISDGDKNTWHWWRVNIDYSPPYFNGMMCCVRFSKKMMECINNYASKNNTLCFIETLFPTLAINNDLIYSNPDEFNKIYFKCGVKGELINTNHTHFDFNDEIINPNSLYHPVKNLNDHISFRNTYRDILIDKPLLK